MGTESTSRSGISRRSFLTGAALTGVAAAGASLVGCSPSSSTSKSESTSNADVIDSASPSWLGAEPEIAESDITKTEETDFLVIGAGTAGMCAAGTAAELGMNFILAEKNDKVPETREYLAFWRKK